MVPGAQWPESGAAMVPGAQWPESEAAMVPGAQWPESGAATVENAWRYTSSLLHTDQQRYPTLSRVTLAFPNSVTFDKFDFEIPFLPKFSIQFWYRTTTPNFLHIRCNLTTEGGLADKQDRTNAAAVHEMFKHKYFLN